MYQKLIDCGFTIQSGYTESGIVYWLGEEGDMSVGIWPLELTPAFSTVKEIEEYLNTEDGKNKAYQIIHKCYDALDLEWLKE